jgi:hypothetical protein
MPFVIDLVADEPCKSVSVSTILMTGHSFVEINREKPSLLCASSLIDCLSQRLASLPVGPSYVCCRTDMPEFQLYIEKPEQI